MIDLILLSVIIGYGITLGVSNTIIRVMSWFHMTLVNQNTFGNLLDVVWYSMITFWLLK